MPVHVTRSLIKKSFLGQLAYHRKERGFSSSSQPDFGPRRTHKYSVNTAQVGDDDSRGNVAKQGCAFCLGQHAIWRCERFSKQPLRKRRAVVKSENLCFNCLGSHLVRACKSKPTCRECGGRHNTLLHEEHQEVLPKENTPPLQEWQDVNGAGLSSRVMSVVQNIGSKCNEHPAGPNTSSFAQTKDSTAVRLKVVPVRVWGAGRRRHADVYAFLDEGSDTSLCTEDLIKLLGLKGKPTQFSLSTMSGTEQQSGRQVSLCVQCLNEDAVVNLSNVLSVTRLPDLSASIPSCRDNEIHAEVIKGVTFPDLCGKVELLIGANVPEAHRTLEYRLNQSGGPNAVKSPLGWSLIGPTQGAKTVNFVNLNFVQTDSFKVRTNVKENTPTRRGILSTVSQCYDPLGFVQPALLPAKMLMQDLCSRGLGWDETVSPSDMQRWNDWLDSLPALQDVEIPRCVKPSGFELKSSQLHCFCDASQTNYGAVIYMRSVSVTGEIHYSFIVARSRVAPIKPVTIPRMELVAAVVGVELTTFLKRELDLKLNDTIFWTDSTSVLQYIKSSSKRFKTFVANRIAAIQAGSSPSQWRHVGTAHNPADMASRGISPSRLAFCTSWLKGPDFLWKDEDAWPIAPIGLISTPPVDPELLKVHQVNCTNTFDITSDKVTLYKLLTHYSSWSRLRRAVAYLLRLKQFLLTKSKNGITKNMFSSQYLSVEEFRASTLAIVKLVQIKYFHKELNSLKNNDRFLVSGTKNIHSHLRKLCPIQVNGILRVGGRLQNSSLSDSAKHPIILPSNHHVTKLIILDIHEKEGHVGPLHTLSVVRQHYWVVKGHVTVRKVIRECRFCRHMNAQPGKQLMAPLPSARVTPGKPPFAFTGVDYAGLYTTTVGRRSAKRYICLFSCMTTRAVHLECAYALDVDSFLLALQRFTARRCTPEAIYSDNGTNFTAAERELRLSINKWNQQSLPSKLAQRGIRWHFNPPVASHQGGSWERIIRSVKRTLAAISGGATMSDETFTTFLIEVERILNDRPITKIASDSRDLEALTPNALLKRHLEPSLPMGVFAKADGYRKSSRLIGLLADRFWSRWLKEYLPLLQQRQRWLVESRNFQVGDVVLVIGEKSNRGQWPKGLIEEVHKDKDGFVRSVRLRTSQSLVRDIRKLCLLEEHV